MSVYSLHYFYIEDRLEIHFKANKQGHWITVGRHAVDKPVTSAESLYELAREHIPLGTAPFIQVGKLMSLNAIQIVIGNKASL